MLVWKCTKALFAFMHPCYFVVHECLGWPHENGQNELPKNNWKNCLVRVKKRTILKASRYCKPCLWKEIESKIIVPFLEPDVRSAKYTRIRLTQCELTFAQWARKWPDISLTLWRTWSLGCLSKTKAGTSWTLLEMDAAGFSLLLRFGKLGSRVT